MANTHARPRLPGTRNCIRQAGIGTPTEEGTPIACVKARVQAKMTLKSPRPRPGDAISMKHVIWQAED